MSAPRITPVQKGNLSGVVDTLFKGVGAMADNLFSAGRNADLRGIQNEAEKNRREALDENYPLASTAQRDSAIPTSDGVTGGNVGSLYGNTNPANPGTIPEPLKQLGEQLTNLRNAHEQKRLSTVNYYARQESAMRETMAKYPHVPRADFRKVYKNSIGYDPTEKLTDALTRQEEYERRRSDRSEDRWVQQQKDAAEVGIPAKFIQTAGRTSEGRNQIVMETLHRKGQESNIKRREMALNLEGKETEASSRRAEELANLKFDTEAARLFSNATASTMGKGIVDRLQQFAARGSKPLSASEMAEVQQIASQLEQQKQAIKQRVLYTPVEDSTGQKMTLASRIRDQQRIDGIEKRIDAQFTFYKDAISNQQYGILFHNKNMLEAAKDGAGLSAMKIPLFERIAGLEKIGAKDAVNMAITRNVEKLGSALENYLIGNGVIDAAEGKPARESLRRLKEEGVTNPRAYQSVVKGQIDVLTNDKASPQAGIQAAKSLFGPENIGMLNGDATMKFDSKSKLRIFSEYTSPKVVERIKQLGAVDPSVMQQYKAWAEDAAVTVTRENFDTLRTHISTPSDSMRITFDGKRFQVNYSTSVYRPDERYNEGASTVRNGPLARGAGGPVSMADRQSKEAVDNINLMLGNLEGVAAATGEDPVQLFQKLIGSVGIVGETKTKLDEALKGFQSFQPATEGKSASGGSQGDSSESSGGKDSGGANEGGGVLEAPDAWSKAVEKDGTLSKPIMTEDERTRQIDRMKAEPADRKRRLEQVQQNLDFVPGKGPDQPPKGVQTLDDGTQIEWQTKDGVTSRRIKPFNGSWGEFAEVSTPKASGLTRATAVGEAMVAAPIESVSQLRGVPRIAKPDEPVFNEFMATIRKGGVRNPYALAAIAATGNHESQFQRSAVNGEWDDPSTSGAPGKSGGIMSWRAERLQSLREFARANGEKGNGGPATQAKFLLAENPALIKKLNESKSAEEAMTLMNNAWRFAGYNESGGERDKRLKSATVWATAFEQGRIDPGSRGNSGETVRQAIGLPGDEGRNNALRVRLEGLGESDNVEDRRNGYAPGKFTKEVADYTPYWNAPRPPGVDEMVDGFLTRFREEEQANNRVLLMEAERLNRQRSNIEFMDLKDSNPKRPSRTRRRRSDKK